MAVWNGIDLVPKIDGVELVCDEISFEPELVDDDRKPTNSRVPVKHMTGRAMVVKVKGAPEQALPRQGEAVAFTLELRDEDSSASLSPEVADIIAGHYDGWGCTGGDVTSQQGIAEYSREFRSNCGTFVPAVVV